jgi:RNA polymerase sigma factor (sigma-70 family)
MINDISAILEDHEGSLDIIMDIADAASSSYSSFSLEKEDLQQEVFLFCVSALERYDGRGPLENFLRKHAKNQILNLIRYNKRRKIINETVDVDALREVLSYEPKDVLEERELLSIIEDELSINERKILMKMLDGIPVVNSRRTYVREKVREIIIRRTGEDPRVG